ncbi:MAG TPA: DinB family protein [Ardenticatenaceae bacterium]
MAQPVLDKLAKDREKLLEAVAQVPDHALDQRVGDGWTVREALTHLANAEEDHRSVIEATVGEGTRSVPENFELNEHNRRRVDERGTLSREELLALLDEQRARTEALFGRLSEEQLETEMNHPALGTMAVGKIFRIIGMHERMHAQEIAAVAQDGTLSQ